VSPQLKQTEIPSITTAIASRSITPVLDSAAILVSSSINSSSVSKKVKISVQLGPQMARDSKMLEREVLGELLCEIVGTALVVGTGVVIGLAVGTGVVIGLAVGTGVTGVISEGGALGDRIGLRIGERLGVEGRDGSALGGRIGAVIGASVSSGLSSPLSFLLRLVFLVFLLFFPPFSLSSPAPPFLSAFALFCVLFVFRSRWFWT